MNLLDVPGAAQTTLSLAESIKKWSPMTRTLAILAVLLFLVGGAIGGYFWKDSQMAKLQEQTQKAHDAEVKSLKEQVGSKDEQLHSKETIVSIKDTELSANMGILGIIDLQQRQGDG